MNEIWPSVGRQPPPPGGRAALMDAWDSLAHRRPPGGPPLPVFVCVGPEGDEVVRSYEDRLASDPDSGDTPIPHVLVNDRIGEEPKDDLEFFDEVANGLVQHFPAAMGKLRLGLYWLLRDVFDIQLKQREHNARRTELSRQLFALHRERTRSEETTTEAGRTVKDLTSASSASLVAQAVAVGASLIQPLQRFAFWWSLRRRRVRMLTSGLARAVKKENKGFLDAGLAFVHDAPARQDHELVRRMLMLALLQDLDAATRHSLISTQRRRRTTPFCVLLPSVSLAPYGAASRFLEAFRVVSHTMSRGSMLLVASTSPDALTGHPDAGPSVDEPEWLPHELFSVDETRMHIETLAAPVPATSRRTHMVPHAVIGVDTPGPGGRAEDSWLRFNPKVVAHPGVRTRTVPIALLCTLAILVLAVAVVVVKITNDPACSDIREASGSTELIGISDGKPGCSFFAHPRNDVEREIKAVEQRIAKQNESAIDDAHERYVEVVFLAPLTTLDKPAHGRYSSLRELRGVALAQKTANDEAADDPNKVFMVVRVANPGDSFAHGIQVAQDIVDVAEDNDRIIGVVGISQSREVSQEAIGDLGASGLPVVGGTVTADDMVGTSARYYQVAPQNDRIAEMMATFAHNHPTVGLSDPASMTARHAVIVMDHSDEYSENLAADIHRHFTRSGHEVKSVHSYPLEDEDRPLPDYSYPVTRAGSFSEIAAAICEDLDLSRDIVFFTGRSTQVPGLLNALDEETNCGTATRPMTIVAGDTLTRLPQDPTIDLGGYPFLRLYYAALAAPRLAIDDLTTPGQFVEDYVQTFPGTRDEVAFDINDPALNYDALGVLLMAANNITERGSLPTRDLIAAEFDLGEVTLDGVTGYITFGSANDQARVPFDKPVLIIDALAPGQAPLLACGRFAENLELTRWGPRDLPCPQDETPG